MGDEHSKMTLTHLFGELDIDLDMTHKEIYFKVFDIGENCGYYVDDKKSGMRITGGDNMAVIIHFDENDKVDKIKRAQFYDNGAILVKWHEVKKGSYEPI